mgnify:FL=1
MPLYLYQCKDCGARLEILQDIDQANPKRCGFRCELNREDKREIRGFGELARQISSFSMIKKRQTDTVTPEQAAKVGLSTYQNKGDGTFEKVAGAQGPKILKK